MAITGNNRLPTISRATDDTLVELVYDPVKKTTGLVVSRFGGLWNIEQEVQIGSELLVPYAASNNLIANECVLLPSAPMEFGYKSELLSDICAFLHRYVDLSPVFEQIAAHYVLLTWVYDRFGELPYLRLRGDFGTGKTRALLAIGSLCNKAFFASGASTTSPIFHTLDAFGGTLVLDEADFAYSDARADIVKLLNSGNVKGMPVLRTLINRHREFNPAAFKVFGPKIIAMRGSFQDQALESRFLTEETGGRPLRSDISISLPVALKTEALTLRNRLLHFRLCEYFKINTDPSVLLEGIEPRLNQTAISLLSLVDNSSVRDGIRDNLLEADNLMHAERQLSQEARLIRATLAAFSDHSKDQIALQEIARNFNTASDEFGSIISNKWIGYMLRTRLRVQTRRVGGIYVVSRKEVPRLSAFADRLRLNREDIPNTPAESEAV